MMTISKSVETRQGADRSDPPGFGHFSKQDVIQKPSGRSCPFYSGTFLKISVLYYIFV